MGHWEAEMLDPSIVPCSAACHPPLSPLVATDHRDTGFLQMHVHCYSQIVQDIREPAS